MNEKETLLPCR